MQQIVVGVDGSEGSALGLRWAKREARARSWPIVTMLAWSYVDQHHVEPHRPFDSDYTEADARAALEHYVVAAIGESEGVEIELRVVCDLPARALLAACSPDGILAVGARGVGGFKGLLLGSVSQHCLHHAPCPVAVVRPAARVSDVPHDERIVVGADGSDTGRAALRWAARDAAARDAALEVVYAWHPPYMGGSPLLEVPVDYEALRESAGSVLEEIVAEIDVDLPRPPRASLVEGSPATAILGAGEGADLAVVGSRGHGGFAGLLLGSVSQQVARHASCPVVVVPCRPTRA